MTRADAPLVGWRVWRLKDGRLHSWVIDHVWAAGPVTARCLRSGPGMLSMDWPRQPCPSSPGEGCKCGLWALSDFGQCVNRARSDPSGARRRSAVIGLMAGWGVVAIHGQEGFRCEHARVLGLLSDAVADGSRASRVAQRPPWWHWLTPPWSQSPRTALDRRNSLERAAASQGVPLVSLADAVRCGVLAELGAPAPDLRSGPRAHPRG